MIKSYVNDLNTTAWRIMWSVVTACVCIGALLFAMLVRNWAPTDMQLKVLYALGSLLALMMGLDVAQFASKRFSDIDYQTAKNAGKPNVAVETAGTVVATQGPAAPAPTSSQPPEPKPPARLQDVDTLDVGPVAPVPEPGFSQPVLVPAAPAPIAREE